MKTVALEEHFLTEEIRRAWSETPLEAGEDTRGFDRGDLESRLDDLTSSRIALMDESGVDVQVLSVTTPGLNNLEPARSIALARRTNDLLAATIARSPDRFEGFAVLPMPSPREAATELQRSVRELGLNGAMLHGRVGEKSLDHADFLPVFEVAAALRVPLYIHPQIPQRAVREIYYGGFNPQIDTAFATFGLGWHYECGIQFLRLALAGVFDRWPELQIILGHWGEVVLFYTERLRALERVTKLRRPVVDCMRENLYVTPSGMFNESYLRRSVEVLGYDRIMFSADYPYQYRPGGGPRKFLGEIALTQEEKEKFAHGNWERLCRTIVR
jgi:uncharacterized protein